MVNQYHKLLIKLIDLSFCTVNNGKIKEILLYSLNGTTSAVGLDIVLSLLETFVYPIIHREFRVTS